MNTPWGQLAIYLLGSIQVSESTSTGVDIPTYDIPGVHPNELRVAKLLGKLGILMRLIFTFQFILVFVGVTNCYGLSPGDTIVHPVPLDWGI